MTITGSTGPLQAGLSPFADRLPTLTPLPVGVGIGISHPALAAEVARYAKAPSSAPP